MARSQDGTRLGFEAKASEIAAAAEASSPWHMAAALVTAPTVPDRLRLLLAAAPRVGDADTASIYLRDEASGAPRVVARVGYDLPGPGEPRRHGITHHVLTTGEVVVVDDTSADPRVNPVVLEAGIRSLVALPLMVRGAPPSNAATVASMEAVATATVSGSTCSIPDGIRGGGTADDSQELRAIGVLYVNAKRPHAFPNETVEALEGLAALTAVAIENGYLLETHRAAAKHLSDVLQLREQFASAASHELKTPLTPLKGYAQAIQRRLDRAAASGVSIDIAWLQRALSIMLGQIDRLDRLVGDLLDVSRLRTGRFTIEPETMNLAAVAHEVFQQFQDAMAAQAEALEPEDGHRLILRVGAPEMPGNWDPNRLDQLITNLLNNAVKYSPEGGDVELIVEPADPKGERLAGSAPDLGEGWVHLAVRDEGIGLPAGEEAKAALFEAFTRGSNAPAERFSGFGLGLYICAEIVRRHGGAIWPESPGLGKGTTFHVLLPPEPPSS